MTKQIDFTRGNITTQLILFALPLIAGELLQNLYNSVDALVVGNFVSDAALGAVSVCATLVNLVVSFFNGMSVGATSVVARAVGRNDEVHRRQSIQITFTFSAALGAALSVLGVLCTDFLIGLSAVEPEIYSEAAVYLRIYLAGTFFTVIYNNGAGILRAVGNTRTPFLILRLRPAQYPAGYSLCRRFPPRRRRRRLCHGDLTVLFRADSVSPDQPPVLPQLPLTKNHAPRGRLDDP